MIDLDKARILLEKQKLEYDFACRQEIELTAGIGVAEEVYADTLSAQEAMQGISQGIQEMVHGKISAVVTRCLKSVFGAGAYDFRILFEKKRGKTEARLAFVRDGVEYDPTKESGGGAIDVAAFALRLCSLVARKPRPRMVLFLDEPFRFVSAEYRPAVVQLMEQVCEEFQMQVLQVTHSDDFQIGKVVEL
jgi:DNA repair exonuclease SbcCD ATPase subunit